MTAAIRSHGEKSTTVRSTHLPRRVEPPWTAAAALRLARLGGTGAAAAVAERLFLSPPRHRTGGEEPAALAGADRFEVVAAGERLACWRVGIHGPAVLLVHGWGGRGRQLAPFVASLRSAGASAILFDAPAHGASTGRLASGFHVAEAIAAIVAATGARGAIGHSLGGLAVAIALARGVPLDAVVLVGPPRTPASFFAAFADAFALPGGVRTAARERIARRFGVAMEDVDAAAIAARLRTPALVVHDRADAEVPFADGEAIARAWPGARLAATDGLGHRRVLRAPEVHEEAARFLAANLPRCDRCGRLASSDPEVGGVCEGCRLGEELFDASRRRPG
jgi:pimeloyl-ACP methyl ester carboxylesterase